MVASVGVITAVLITLLLLAQLRKLTLKATGNEC